MSVSPSASPRLMLHEVSLLSATWEEDPESLRSSAAARSHVVETAVGAHLIALSAVQGFQVNWWRDGDKEVDFVVKHKGELFAIEVKSGRAKSTGGLEEFCRRYPEAKPVIVGDRNLTLEAFLKSENLP